MKRSPLRKAATRRTASASERLQDRNRKRRRQYFLERLEDRSLLAVLLWSGNDTVLGTPNRNLSDPGNWVGNVAPQQDDTLVFPGGLTGARLGVPAGSELINDLPDGTRLRAITISDGYVINNQGSNKITLLEGVNFNAASGTASVSIPLTLSAGASIISANVGATLSLKGNIDLGAYQTLTTDGRGNIDVSGIVSGTGSSGITK